MPMDNPDIEHGKMLDSVSIPILRSKRAYTAFPSSDDRWELVRAFIRRAALLGIRLTHSMTSLRRSCRR